MKRRSLSKSISRLAPLPLAGGGGASLIFVIAALGSLAFSAVNPDGVGAVRVRVMDALAPALGVVTVPVQSAAMFVRDVSGLAQIQADNARLEQENVKLREWYQTALLLEAENKSLRDLLHVRVEPENRFITAGILADVGGAFVKSMLIDAGADNGVLKGQAVVSGEGVVGRVVEAGHNASRVLLVTDMNSRVPVLIEDTRQHAILAGQNELNPALVHIPQDSDIKKGARIITSGFGGIFPQGLPVGRVYTGEDGVYRVK
ncbi:MAG: rod shape-determining protein MreC, partial [Alphaproteobacteria bacterium]